MKSREQRLEDALKAIQTRIFVRLSEDITDGNRPLPVEDARFIFRIAEDALKGANTQ